MKNLFVSSFALAALAVLGPVATSQSTVVEAQKVGNPTAKYLSKFGDMVAVEGDLAVISSPLNTFVGRLLVFDRIGPQGAWSFQAEVKPLPAFQAIGIGNTLLLDAGEIWAGAPETTDGAISNRGFVSRFVNQAGTWTQSTTLRGDGPGEYDLFGESLAKHNGTIVVGAPAANNDAGAVYVFQETAGGWVQQAKLTDAGGQSLDYFGYKVALHGSVLAIGGLGTGAVHVYREIGGVWTLEQELFSPDLSAGGAFGFAIAVEGDLLVIGGTESQFSGAGAAYAFRWGGTQWALEQKITPIETQPKATFGGSLDIEAGRIVVGSPGFGGVTTPSRGAVYQFHHNGSSWVEVQRWTSTDYYLYVNAPGTGGSDLAPRLGHSVSLNGDTIIAGAPFGGYGHDKGVGSAYFFTVSDLALDVVPDAPIGGQTVSLNSQGGLVGTPSFMYLVSIGGIPVLEWVGAASGTFSQGGGFGVTLPVSPSLTGLTVELASIGFWNPTTFGVSNVVEVTFQ